MGLIWYQDGTNVNNVFWGFFIFILYSSNGFVSQMVPTRAQNAYGARTKMPKKNNENKITVPNTVQIKARLDEALYREAREDARKDGESLSVYLRKLVREKVAKGKTK